MKRSTLKFDFSCHTLSHIIGNQALTDLGTEVHQIQTQLNMDIGQLTTRCEGLEARLDRLEQKFHYDIDTTIVAQYVPVGNDEDVNLLRHAEKLVQEGTGTVDARVVRAKRLNSKNNKPGIMKIEMASLDEKIAVLRNKRKLKDHPAYNMVYIRSSKSHEQRLLEANVADLLYMLPDGDQYRIAGNGRIVHVEEQTVNNPSSSSSFTSQPIAQNPQDTGYRPNWQNFRGPRSVGGNRGAPRFYGTRFDSQRFNAPRFNAPRPNTIA